MTRVIKDGWLTGYLAYTQNHEAPENFHLWSALATLSGAIRRNIWIDKGYYTLYPNLYIVLVAETAECRKSAAASIGVKFLRCISDVNIIQGRITPEAMLANMNRSHTNGNGVISQRSDIFIYASEMAATFGKAAYVEELIVLLTELFMTDHFDYETRNKGKFKIEGPCPTLLGATQPDWVVSGLGRLGRDIGIMNRIVFVPEKIRKMRLTTYTMTQADINLKDALENDICHIAELSGPMIWSKDAYATYDDWYMTKPDAKGHNIQDEFMAREHDIALKIAMLLSISINDDLIILQGEMEAAIKLVNIIRNGISCTFMASGGTDEARIGMKIMRSIEKYGPTDRSQLLRRHYHLIRDARQFDGILDILISQGILERTKTMVGALYSIKQDETL